jgi:hypothetical protein
MHSAIGKWCLGLPYEGVRELYKDEVEHLERRIASFKNTSLGYALASLSIFAVIIIYAGRNGFFYPLSEAFEWGVSAAVLMALWVLAPLFFVMAIDYLKKARALQRDIAKGFIYLFSGIIGDADELSKKQLYLIRNGLLTTQGNAAQQIEILPVSGVVFKANRQVPHRWVHADIGEAVASPKRPFILALPKDMLAVALVGKLKLSRRRMSDEEATELLSHIHRMREPHIVLVLYAAFLIGVFLVSYVHQPAYEWLQNNPGYLAFAGWIFLMMVFFYLVSILQSRKLVKDSQLGWLILFPLDGKAAFKGSDPAATRAELLPVSFGAWNVAGKPSLWRLIKPKAA